MPTQDPDQDSKLETLRAMQLAGTSPRVAELILVKWPAPDGPIFYGTRMAPDILDKPELLDRLEGPIELRFGNTFLDVTWESGIADDTLDLDFWDGDDELSRLSHTHGEGMRVEVFYYFPEVDLLLSQWWGHLRTPDEADGERFKAKAQSGFRSSNLPLPRRAFFTGCQAPFGGSLTTQAEIDDNDCPYSRHLGGTRGVDSFATDDTWLQSTTFETNWQGLGFDESGWDAAVEEGDAADFPWNSHPPAFPSGATAKWIWDHDSSVSSFDSATVYFRKTFVAAGESALLVVTADNAFTAFLNGEPVASGSNWQQSQSVLFALTPGETYVLAVKVVNGEPQNSFVASPGGLIAEVAYGLQGMGFGNMDPDTGLPYTSCPKNNRTVCAARLGDDLSYLAFDTIVETHVVHETKGPNITVTSRGNETNLKRSLRVIAGKRHVRDLDLLTYTVEPNTNHPELGSIKTLFGGSEGPVKSLTNFKINGNTIGPQHLNVRLGERRQPKTSFSAQINNYSGTSLALGVAQGDFTKSSPEDIQGECDIEGSRDVRIYNSDGGFIEEYSVDRAFWLLHMLRNKRWGLGYDVARFLISDYVYLSAWGRQIVSFTDKDGTLYTGQRTMFNAELIDRTAQQQISDLCLAGRFGLPFHDRGMLRVVPLARATELFSPTIFTDHVFKGVLDRVATDEEFAEWVAALESAADVSEIAKLAEATARIVSLLASEEYDDRARTDEEYVDDLYHAFLDRVPDVDGKEFWLKVIADGGIHGRANALAGFEASGEYIDGLKDLPIPLFTDEGDDRNIVRENGKTTLVRSQIWSGELTNRIVITFDDEEHQNSERPLTFENERQQFAAGRAFGDSSRRVVEQSYTAYGVTSLGETSRLGNLILDLGEFDEGGIENNLRITFTTWYLFTLELHKYSIIKVKSSRLDRYGFDYFRIRSMRRLPDLKVEISAQAYPADYYERLEKQSIPPPLPPSGIDDPPDGRAGRIPWKVRLLDFGHTLDEFHFQLMYGAPP